MAKEKVVERIAFGVLADKDTYAEYFSISDRFLIIELENRKTVIHREYRPNPYAEVCKEKYPMPTDLGEEPTDEELEVYDGIAQVIKECNVEYVGGRNFGFYPKTALDKVGKGSLMTSEEPQEWIDSLIENRRIAGFHD